MQRLPVVAQYIATSLNIKIRVLLLQEYSSTNLHTYYKNNLTKGECSSHVITAPMETETYVLS